MSFNAIRKTNLAKSSKFTEHWLWSAVAQLVEHLTGDRRVAS